MNPTDAEPKPPRELLLKAKVEPFQQAVKLHKGLFFFIFGTVHVNERTLILFVFRRDAGGKCLADVEDCESSTSPRAERGSGARQLGVQAVYRPPGVDPDHFALHDSGFLMTKT